MLQKQDGVGNHIKATFDQPFLKIITKVCFSMCDKVQKTVWDTLPRDMGPRGEVKGAGGGGGGGIRGRGC